jgi:hypothetical protein
MGYDFRFKPAAGASATARRGALSIDSHGRSNLVSLSTNRVALSGRAVIVTCDQAQMKHTRLNKQPAAERA